STVSLVGEAAVKFLGSGLGKVGAAAGAGAGGTACDAGVVGAGAFCGAVTAGAGGSCCWAKDCAAGSERAAIAAIMAKVPGAVPRPARRAPAHLANERIKLFLLLSSLYLNPGGDGKPATHAERLGSDFQDWRGLLTFVFRFFDQAHHLLDEIEGKSVRLGDLIDALVTLHVGFEDGVEHLVGRERIGVALAGAKFGRGRLVEDGLRNYLAFTIEPSAYGIDAGFDQVADHGQGSNHVAIKRAVADSHFRF